MVWKTINAGASVRNFKYLKYITFGILLHIVVKKKNIMNISTITCDEIIEWYNEEKKLFQQILIKRMQTINYKSYVLAFLLIAIALLIPVSIHCFLINYPAKQKKVTFLLINRNK